MEPLIQVRGLTKHFTSGVFRTTRVRALDGVSFDIARGETLGVMGESGCGKSTLARVLTRLVEPTAGEVRLGGENFLDAHGERLRQQRQRIQMVFQDAEGSLDPRMRVRQLLVEPLRVHGLLDGAERATQKNLLELVNLTPDLLDRFPHELSGGQRQRIGMARALSLDPDIIVADEPAASLDLSVQAQLLELLQRTQQDRGISYLLITHNLRVLRLLAHRVAVMYLGRFVEMGPTAQVFSRPAHPYTQALVSSVHARQDGMPRSPTIEGEPPSPINPPAGCHFHPRCPHANDRCRRVSPTLHGKDRLVACHLVESE